MYQISSKLWNVTIVTENAVVPAGSNMIHNAIIAEMLIWQGVGDFHITILSLKFVEMIEYMGTSVSTVEKQLNNYITRLNATQRKALLGVAKSYLEPKQESEPLEDKAYEAEMNRRFKEMESGKLKLYTLDEAEAHARGSYKSTKRKK